MKKKYDKYHVGHTKRGWYVACLDIDPSGRKEFLPAFYLHQTGEVHSFAGTGTGYFETELAGQAAILEYKGNFLPENLFELE